MPDQTHKSRTCLERFVSRWERMCRRIRILFPVAGISPSSLSLRILLAEDNLVNQRVAMTMLGKMGHRITLATNGLEAVEQWRQSDFDLILMDVQMPGMTG